MPSKAPKFIPVPPSYVQVVNYHAPRDWNQSSNDSLNGFLKIVMNKFHLPVSCFPVLTEKSPEDRETSANLNRFIKETYRLFV